MDMILRNLNQFHKLIIKMHGQMVKLNTSVYWDWLNNSNYTAYYT